MQLGLPKRILGLAKDEELKEIRHLVTTSKQFNWHTAAEHKQRSKSAHTDFCRRWRECSDVMRYWRKVLRKRHELSFNSGLYRTTRSNCHGYDGAIGMRYTGAVKKGTLLVWVERNELGHNFFMMPSNEVVCIRGTYLDGVASVKREK